MRAAWFTTSTWFSWAKASAFNTFTRFLRGSRKYTYCRSAADHVITCTPYLDEYVRKYNPHTTDISSTIRTDDYQPINAYTNDRQCVLGWSGSHSTAPYLKLLHWQLLELRKKHKFRLRVIGEPSFKLDGLEVEALPWSGPTEVRDLQAIDIGLYPLPDEQWVYGKSGLKALQYMALGIPAVATAIGTNFRVIEDGVSGYLVKSEEEWVRRLDHLLSNPGERRRIGLAASERVERLYSIKANRATYLDLSTGLRRLNRPAFRTPATTV